MTARKRKSLDAALRTLFQERSEERACASLVALAQQLAASPASR